MSALTSMFLLHSPAVQLLSNGNAFCISRRCFLSPIPCCRLTLAFGHPTCPVLTVQSWQMGIFRLLPPRETKLSLALAKASSNTSYA